MKIRTSAINRWVRAFTLPEVMVASCIGLGVGAAMVFLLIQGAVEQRNGLASASLEQKAHNLQSCIVSCLRGMSANQGLSPDYTTALNDSGGHLLGYQTVFFFLMNADGSYTRNQIVVDPNSHKVTYVPDVTHSTTSVTWMTNTPSVALRQLCFSTSFNPDGSLNGSLINVQFLMDDNGNSRRAGRYSPISVFRTFAVQMRSDL